MNRFVKFVILVAVFLAIVQKITGSSAFTNYFVRSLGAIIHAVMPGVIVIGGIYIIIKALFNH